MSFLAPLFLAGLAAVGLPIILHLIRRTPRGQVPFSTLMFLEESPPRMTRRSRLDQWLLLLLRAAAVVLLALAFARPFLREASNLNLSGGPGRRIALLLDTSASMQRGDLWTRARQQVQQQLEKLDPQDHVALWAFDNRLRTIVDFPATMSNDLVTQRAAITKALAAMAPGWRSTDLGRALAEAADRLAQQNDRSDTDAALQIVVISDLQEGAELAALQSYPWPAHVRVEPIVLEPKPLGNAGLYVLPQRVEGDAIDQLRVRITADALATEELYKLTWRDAAGKPIGRPVSCVVPPGQSRTVRIERPTDVQSARLTLSGDTHLFDNVAYVAPLKLPTAKVVYVGPDSTEDPTGLAYFLSIALGDTPYYRAQLQTASAEDAVSEALVDATVAVVGGQLNESMIAALRSFAQGGGAILVALTDHAAGVSVQKLLESEELTVSEASLSDYAMLSEMDLQHPLFAQFADPRFGDFTKIRFWKMRQVSWNGDEDAELHAVARFDNGHPALIQQNVGEGTIYVLTSSWKPDDSQLALSSKFVPLIGGLLRQAVGAGGPDTWLTVGQPIVLQAVGASAAAENVVASSILLPSGERASIDSDALNYDNTEEPGLYRLDSAAASRWICVNVDPAESRTAARDPTQLEQYGVQLGQQPDDRQLRERQRQLLDQELEKRQQVWRWMIAAAVVLLVGETWLSGWAARKVRRGAQ